MFKDEKELNEMFSEKEDNSEIVEVYQGSWKTT